MEEVDDLVLHDRWCTGDKQAGTLLFRRHIEALYRFFSTKVEPADLDEPVQETFLVCVKKRDEFRKHSSFRTFLFAIARLVLYEYWRRRRGKETPVDFDEISVASLSTTAGTRLTKREDRMRLLAAMRELPVEQQLLLELSYWEGLEGSDLATVFDVEPATIRSRLFRAREALRTRMQAAETNARPDTFDGWAAGLRAQDEEREAVSKLGNAARIEDAIKS